jgi:hypothetical protein
MATTYPIWYVLVDAYRDPEKRRAHGREWMKRNPGKGARGNATLARATS